MGCGKSARGTTGTRPRSPRRVAGDSPSSGPASGCFRPLHSVSTFASSLSALNLWTQEESERPYLRSRALQAHRNSPRRLALIVMVEEMVLSRSQTVRRVERGGRRMLTCKAKGQHYRQRKDE